MGKKYFLSTIGGNAFEYANIGSAASMDCDDKLLHRKPTLILQIFFDKGKRAEFGLNESKRNKFLRLLLRIKRKRKMQMGKGNRIKSLCLIPQPPPPPNAERNARLSQMDLCCSNFNWNGKCDAVDCVKKHECVSCGGLHSARVCGKECLDFNWAKCEKYCPHKKRHQCSQCGDRSHPAWKCKYLHKCVKDRFYSLHKHRKIKQGYFANQQCKAANKNKASINKKLKK